MTFIVTQKCSVIKNYPEIGIMIPGDNEMLDVSYTAIIVNSLSNSTADVQFDVYADGVGHGLITFSFLASGTDGLLKQAEIALQESITTKMKME
ncbi:Uncharacterised protein [Klebsiella pneumoniae]|uniref:hypothetical protein n=1 Tax=Klebsiella pneumoniae complex TaxID=3390273 RepID=UPI000B9552A8|nr:MULTISPECIES: hypothetical protein [Klebsiella]OYF77434.1 hypothetical protein CI612_19895 [Klebsiella quasipneumoniae subsp. similipneumoniae]VGC54125.1 Uncharacterised protein [Klebsiella pneumoniae]